MPDSFQIMIYNLEKLKTYVKIYEQTTNHDLVSFLEIYFRESLVDEYLLNKNYMDYDTDD